MSKLIETLKNNGWVETTLGECQMGEEVLLTQDSRFPQAVRVTKPAEWGGQTGPLVNTSDGGTHWGTHWGTTPVLRAPRPECAPGTVALITWDGQDKPMRAMRLNENWVAVDNWYVLEGSAEVVRVLLPADQDTPPITDEMVERAAEACYLARDGAPTPYPGWDKACEDFPAVAARYRREARAVLKAALENEKEK